MDKNSMNQDLNRYKVGMVVKPTPTAPLYVMILGKHDVKRLTTGTYSVTSDKSNTPYVIIEDIVGVKASIYEPPPYEIDIKLSFGYSLKRREQNRSQYYHNLYPDFELVREDGFVVHESSSMTSMITAYSNEVGSVMMMVEEGLDKILKNLGGEVEQ